MNRSTVRGRAPADRFARVVALLALALALTASYGSAGADPSTEPDAAALALRVADLEANALITQDAVDRVEVQNQEFATLIEDLFANDAILDDRTAENPTNGCIGYSDFRYFKERVSRDGRRGKVWRLPVAVWLMDDPACRPNPKKQWRPSRRALHQLKGITR